MGGRDVREFIRRCLRRLLCDELAQNYSLHGHKAKSPFKSLIVMPVLELS